MIEFIIKKSSEELYLLVETHLYFNTQLNIPFRDENINVLSLKMVTEVGNLKENCLIIIVIQMITNKMYS